MFTRFAKAAIARTAFAAGTVGVAALLAAGTANATSAADQQFLSLLRQQGISVDSPSDAINVGHNVCSSLGEGTTPRDISGKLTAANPDMSEQDSLNFIVDSVKSYCPQFMHDDGNGGVVISAA